MKYLLLLFLLLKSLTANEAEAIDPFAPEAPMVITPRKVVDIAPLAKTNNPATLYFLDIPSLHHTPSPLEKMPRITPKTTWENTATDDLIYDISAWFPNVKSNNKKALWVYFNQSKGIIVTRADEWLIISVREYILNTLLNGSPLKMHFTIDYITVDASTKPTLDTFKQCIKDKTAKRHLHFSSSCSSTETITHNTKDLSIKLSPAMFQSAESIDLELKLEHKDKRFNTFLRILSDTAYVFPIGFNEKGKKSYLLVSAKITTIRNNVIKNIPKRSEPFYFGKYIRSEKEKEHSDPLHDEESVTKLYSVSVDFHILMQAKMKLLRNDRKKEQKDFLYDISEALSEAGIPLKKDERAIFNRSKGLLIVFCSEDSHELVENLMNDIKGGYRLNNLVTELSFYSVDPQKTTDKDFDYDLLLQSDPKKIYTINSTTAPSVTQTITTKLSKVSIDPNLDESGYDYDVRYKLDISEPDFILKKDFTCTLHRSEPKFIELDIKHNGRPVVMVVRMIDSRENKVFHY